MHELTNDTTGTCVGTYSSGQVYASSTVTVMGTATVFIFLASLAANFIVLYIFYRCSSLLTTSNRFIVNLTVCNVLNALFVTPFMFITVISQCWHFGHIWCNVTAFLTTATFAASTLTLFVISFDRYCAVVSPLHYRMRITRRRANLMTISVWLVAIVCALPPLFGWNHYEYQWEKRSCTVFWRSRATGDKYYTVFLTLLCFVIPLVAMVWAYVAMYRAACGNSERTRRNSMINRRPSSDANCPNFATMKVGTRRGSVITELLFNRRMSSASLRQGQLLWHRDEWKAAVTSLLVVSTFVVCWLPYFIIIILETTIFDSSESISPVIQQVAIILALSNSALNPVVYVFRSKAVRRELHTIFLHRQNTLKANTILERSDETIDSLNNGETMYRETPGQNGSPYATRTPKFDSFAVDV